MSPHDETSFLQLDEVQIYFRDIGPRDAATTVVLLHGFPLQSDMWQFQEPALSEKYRLILPDLRGHGRSSVTTGTVGMDVMADDVAKLLDFAQIEQAVICGLSMGGYVAWEFWQRYPQKTLGLMLCDTRSVADTEEVARARHMMAAQVVTEGAAMAAKSMLPKLLAAETHQQQPAVVQLVEQMILATDPQGIAATQRGMAGRRDFTATLPEIDVPSLVICGSEDGISPPAEMAQIGNALPRAEFVEIPNAGHLAPLEQPTTVNEAMLRFLANVSSD